MKWLQMSLLLVLLSSISFCSKNNGQSGNGTAPTNLNVVATVSTDSSGNVSFVSTAANAVTYEYSFGDGNYQTVPSGSVTHKYPSSGSYAVYVDAKNAGGLTVAKTVNITVGVALSLVWSDEFSNTGAPDPAKWGYDLGNNNGWGNNELEYYTDSLKNAFISNGTLKITAIKESRGGFPYTSARLLTKDKFSFKYGKIEVRAKLPAGAGTWPAIWMLGSNISTVPWPGCGEVDIMEQKGTESGKIYSTLHYPGHSGANGVGSTTTIANTSTDFHRYAAIWTPTTIQFLVDDIVFYSFSNNSTLPFNLNFFIILNFAMGGDFGGSVDPSFTNANMEVDYVRVYQ